MNKIIGLVLATLIVLQSYDVVAATTDIIIWDNSKESNPLIFNILILALNKNTSTYGPYNIIFAKVMQQARSEIELQKNNNINLIAFAPTAHREEKLIAIRIPLMKGLLGYRLCLINKNDQQKFNGIKSIEDWRQRRLTIGQVAQWPDTKILRFNQLEVMTTGIKKLLANMLTYRRFDCYSRSIIEILHELALYKNKHQFVIEKNLLLVYPLPNYFFVSKKNPQLAKRLTEGLMIAINDGSFDKLFNTEFKEILLTLNIENRTLIRLKNPNLTPATSATLANKKLWFDQDVVAR